MIRSLLQRDDQRDVSCWKFSDNFIMTEEAPDKIINRGNIIQGGK